jgi:hypothetical protein
MRLLNQTGQFRDSIYISGNNLSRISDVTFSGNVSGSYIENDINTLIVEVPENIQAGSVKVTSSERSVTGYTENKFFPQPILGDFTPTTGVSGESISLTGTSLYNTTGVEINNLSCEFSVSSISGLLITVPSGNTFGYIKAYSEMPTGVTEDGEVITNSTKEKFHPDIRISGFSITGGQSGDAVGIIGTYFFDELMSGFVDTNNEYEIKYISSTVTGTGVLKGVVQRDYILSLSGRNKFETSSVKTIYRGHTYYFSQNDSSNLGHQFKIGLIPDGPWGDINSGWYSGEYRSGVSFYGSPGSGSGSYTSFEVPTGAPNKLFYYDNYFTGVGGSGHLDVRDPSGFLVSFTPSGATGWFYKKSNTELTGTIPDYATSGLVRIAKHESIE